VAGKNYKIWVTSSLILIVCLGLLPSGFPSSPPQIVTHKANPSPRFASAAPLNLQGSHLLYHTMEVKITNNYALKVLSTVILENNESQPIETFLFMVNKSINTVFVFDPIGPLNFTWKKDDLTHSSVLNISMRYPLLENNKYVFSISYEIDSSALAAYLYHISDFGGYYNLEFPLRHSITTLHFRLEISLPVAHSLLPGPSPRPVFPTPTGIELEDERITLVWLYDDVELSTDYSYFVRFNKTAEAITTLSNPSGLPKAFFIYLFTSFLFGVLGSTAVFYLLVKKRFQPTKTKLVSSLLSEAEQAVIKAINDEGGMAIQRKICERTGFSKSKVSQILLKLEEKEVLKRERWGRTNRVTITNPSFLNLPLEEQKTAD